MFDGAASKIVEWWNHPAQMVEELFKVTPDAWQEKVLEAFPHRQRVAMPAAKGPGKSTVLSWIGWNYLLTRPHPKIGATSSTATNLADGLWTEMAKWQNKSDLLKSTFTWTKTRIFANQHPETWFMAAKSWSKTADANEQSNTLAGFHADYVLFLLDETGAMPRAILVTAEGAIAGCIEAHIVQAGNPTSREGALYHACHVARDLWLVVRITGDPDDPQRSPRIPIEYALEQIKQYGRDNPWVKCNIFGEFPPSSLNALIGDDELAEAAKRYYREHELTDAARVLSADVARFGDDSSPLARRQGLQMWPFKVFRNLTAPQGAAVVNREWDEWKADACFIDETGGFGAGWIDCLRPLGKSPIGVQFAGQAHNPARYVNKRAEMAFDMIDWIKRGGAIPDDPRFISACAQTTYTFQGDRFILEPKEDIKAKLGFSPDEFDAAMIGFAEPVTPQAKVLFPGNSQRSAASEYKPFADIDRAPTRSYAASDSYDPFRQ